MSKFFEVQVRREMFTTVFVEVPDGFTANDITDDIVREAVEDAELGEYEWEEAKDSLEADMIQEVSEGEATSYKWYVCLSNESEDIGEDEEDDD